jgi:hypothetical protein
MKLHHPDAKDIPMAIIGTKSDLVDPNKAPVVPPEMIKVRQANQISRLCADIAIVNRFFFYLVFLMRAVGFMQED